MLASSNLHRNTVGDRLCKRQSATVKINRLGGE